MQVQLGSIPGSGRFPGGGHGNQYSCLENPMDRETWWAMVHRVAKSWTKVKQLSKHAQIRNGEGNGNPLQCSCLENPQRQRSLVGYSSMGCKESDTTE